VSGKMQLLPNGFEALEFFCERWAGENAQARMRLRIESSAEDRHQFYAAASPLLPAALEHLDSRDLTALDEQEIRLLKLMLALAHVSLAEERYGKHEPLHALHLQHMRIVKGSGIY
jgi:hypothetical protein